MPSRMRLLTLVAIGLAIYGCGRASDESSQAMRAGDLVASGADASSAAPGGAMMAEAMKSSAPDGGVDAAASSMETIAQSGAQRQIIRNGIVTIEAADARKAAETLTSTVGRLGGFIGNTSEDVNELGGRNVTLEARVPAPKFDDLMRSLDQLGTVLSRNITAQDVTEEYVDVEAKLRNLKRTEARLLEHLARSGKLSDTLLVERELTRVREQIEQYEGRMRYLKHNVAYSSATITIRDKAKKEPLVPPESFSSGQVASSAVRSLVDFARSIWSVAIWFAVWAPVWLPGVLLLVFLSRKGRGKPGGKDASAP